MKRAPPGSGQIANSVNAGLASAELGDIIPEGESENGVRCEQSWPEYLLLVQKARHRGIYQISR